MSKTTFIREQVRKWAAENGSDSIMLASFTRAAAAELAARDLPINTRQIGTLHSFAYRSVGATEIAETHVDEWNSAHPARALSGAKRDLDDAGQVEQFGATDTDALARQMEVLRARLVPEDHWPTNVRSFHSAWSNWKREEGYLDFTDLIEVALADVDEAPNAPSIGMFDEVQDFTPLELALVRKWGQHMERVLLVGDDDQAQPSYARVLTTRHGYQRMDALDPNIHQLVAYDLRHSNLNGLRKGHDFTIAAHREDARGRVIEVEGVPVECTVGHRWWAKIDPAAGEKCVVYLMRRGSWWRMGWCQLLRSDGVFHLGHRARLERADAAWVVRACDSRSEASQYESMLAARYGLPLPVWNPVHAYASRNSHYSAEVIHNIFTALEDVMKERGERCLADHGRDVRYPIWQPGERSRFGARIEHVRACNLLDGVHLVPRWGGDGMRDVQWRPVRVSEGEHIDVAYSLAVEPHRTYVTDGGVITSNCLYHFKGATPAVFLDTPVDDAHKRILSQSHRVPRAVHQVATKWVEQLSRREPKEYLPRDVDGVVRRLSASYRNPLPLIQDVKRQVDAGRTCMILTSCSYMLADIRRALLDDGLPFHNPYRRKRGDWNPLVLGTTNRRTATDRVLAYLRTQPEVWGDNARWYTGEDARAWAEPIKAEGVFVRGAKKALDVQRAAMAVDLDALLDPDAPDYLANLDAIYRADLDWYEAHLLAAKVKTLRYPLRVAQRRGPAALREEPRCVIGTIHAVKGGEADVVFLAPDMSVRGLMALHAGVPAERDAVIRQFYVAMTRAREELVFLEWGSSSSLDPALLRQGVLSA